MNELSQELWTPNDKGVQVLTPAGMRALEKNIALTDKCEELIKSVDLLTAERDSYRQQAEINARTVREQAQEMARYENGRVVLTGMVKELERRATDAEEANHEMTLFINRVGQDRDDLKSKLQQVTIERDEQKAFIDSHLSTRSDDKRDIGSVIAHLRAGATVVLLSVANGDATLALYALEQDLAAHGCVNIERCISIIQASLATIH